MRNFKTIKSSSVPFFTEGTEEKTETEVEKEEKVEEANDLKNSIPKVRESKTPVFRCDDPNCTKKFFSYLGYNRHLNGRSKCVFKKRKMDSKSYVIKRFRSRFGITSEPIDFRSSRKIRTLLKGLDEPEVLNNKHEVVTVGSALAKRRVNTKTNPDVKIYMKERFDEGKSATIPAESVLTRF